MGKVFNGVKRASYLAGLFVFVCAFLIIGVLLTISSWLFGALIAPVVMVALFCVFAMWALFLVVVFCIEGVKRCFASFAKR